MFERLVAIEPINLVPKWETALQDCAKEVVLYDNRPESDEEIIRRIGNADGVLVSYTTAISAAVIQACPGVRYIGMCCSLYDPKSANVDIAAANTQGITVLGVRDYGDEGVAEYAVYALTGLLHGFGEQMWREMPMELTGLPVGILGMGTTGQLLAKTLTFFGAEIFYYSRTRKETLEQSEGYQYLPLEALLQKADILCTCLNKNAVLLKEKEFEQLGNGKILMNTSIGPGHDVDALARWLDEPGNFALGDTAAAIDPSGRLLARPNVLCAGKSAGMTALARDRLGEKVLANIARFFDEH